MVRGSSGSRAFKQAKKSAGSTISLLRLDRNLSREALARKAQMSRSGLGLIERGEVLPRPSTVSKLACALGVPPKDLIHPTHPPLERVRLRSETRFEFRNQLLAKTGRWLSNYSDLEADLGQFLPLSFSVLKDPGKCPDPIRVAEAARIAAGLEPEQPIHNLCSLLEESGVKILLLVKKTHNFSSFSVGPERGGPVIAVNTWDRISVERWIFSAARELGHLLLHPTEYRREATDLPLRSEREADAFASNFLMPESAFSREWDKARGHPLYFQILRIKRIFRVSYQTILQRLIDSGRENPRIWIEFERQRCRTLGKTLPKSRIREKDRYERNGKRSDEPAGLSPYDFADGRLTRLVRLALEQKRISLQRAAEILDLDLNQMKRRRNDWAGGRDAEIRA